MRAAARWVLLVVVLAVCVSAALGAKTLAAIAWDAVVDYRSPYVSAQLPPSSISKSAATRTVLVIIDGLGIEASRDMPTLQALRAYGADLELTAPQPSLSYPNWTTLLSGAPPYVSGVVTNWHEGEAGVETLFDVAERAGVPTVFAGPADFDTLYGVRGRVDASFMRKWDKRYRSKLYVDKALAMADRTQARLIVVHLPDVDEAGHAYGGASTQYADAVARVDTDLGRLVEGLQDGRTVFVVVADHGHIATGGHGGWEPEATIVPGVFSGPGMVLGSGSATSMDVAPTVAAIAGLPVPRASAGTVLEQVVGTGPVAGAGATQQIEFWRSHGLIVSSDSGAVPPAQGSADELRSWDEAAQLGRLARERSGRSLWAAGAAIACLIAVGSVLLASRPAFLSTLVGVVAYYGVYNLLFFVVHGNKWSLSSFNSEDLVESWLNQRLIESAIAMLVAAVAAGWVYPYLRRVARGPQHGFLVGWLTLGPATALTVLATLGMQIAWFYWQWGLSYTWRLPDLMWGMKFDLDLVQSTAVGLAAILTPLLTLAVGRYHPRVAAYGRTERVTPSEAVPE